MEVQLSHAIAPANVLRGDNAWNKGKLLIHALCKRPLLLGRSESTNSVRLSLFDDLLSLEIHPIKAELQFDCCETDLKRIINIINENNCDGVIAIGGGKVLDAGKLVANRLDMPCITVPLSAATCAGWTALSNIYTPQGAFLKDESLKRCPDLLIFDHSLVNKAPTRLLASGIADALAKWYEASITSKKSLDGLVLQAVQMARVLRDQLLIDGHEALKNPTSDSWVRVAEGCALTAGLIGGIGGPHCRTAAAHAVHNGLTQLHGCQNILHGEKVGLGILIQLHLEETIQGNKLAKQARAQLLKFLKELNLPLGLSNFALSKTSIEDLNEVCIFACRKESEIHFLPFPVNSPTLLNSILSVEDEIQTSSSTHLIQNNKIELK